MFDSRVIRGQFKLENTELSFWQSRFLKQNCQNNVPKIN
jgi:hypothetical protein